MDPNYIGIALAIFFGLFSIGCFIHSGFRSFRDVKEIVLTIKDKTLVIESNMSNLWNLLSAKFSGVGTVERESKHFGKVKITARPHNEQIIYVLRVEKGLLDGGLISNLTKSTNFEDWEMKLFNGEIAKVNTPTPRILNIELPTNDPTICTEYMSKFLAWLDSVYVELQPKIEDFEEPINF